MSRVRNENYIVIQGFMINELKLKGNELLVYAIIYGFSQDGQRFSGSLQYLADWTNSTKQGVMKNLRSLADKGLIMKEDSMLNGVKFVSYYATQFNGVCNSVEWGMQQSLMGGMQLSLPNNIETDIKENNKGNNKRFIPPTREEVQAYCLERKNSVDADRFIDYYTANGWKVGKNKMKDWKATVRTWEKNNYGGQRSQSHVKIPLPEWATRPQKEPEKASPELIEEMKKMQEQFRREAEQSGK